MNYSVYHDESECEKSNFLYHGYLYIHNDYREEIITKLASIRGEKWKNKRVHFVEIKLPSTPLFGIDKNRSNSWKLSDDLFNAKSQILEQKASGLAKLHQKHSEEDEKYNKIEGKSYDSKVILIIGNIKKELANNGDADGIQEIKRKTFELFRNDSKNIEIITYDELYRRAQFIISSKLD